MIKPAKENETKSEHIENRITVDEKGHLIIPEAIKKFMGAENHADMKIVVKKDRVELYPNIHSLSKVYIEPTTLCNLSCKTCVRNTWEESIGEMSLETFDRLIDQLKSFKYLQTIMFGGFGEPTYHKNIQYMIGKAKTIAEKVEMVSNGTLLDDNMLQGFIDNKLDTLWVSFDGTSEKLFEEIRSGANYTNVVESLLKLKTLNSKSEHKVKVGITFVLMQDNIGELTSLKKIANYLGANMVSVSNVIPYSEDMSRQTLYNMSISQLDETKILNTFEMSLPLIDINKNTQEHLNQLYKSNQNISIMRRDMFNVRDECRFIKERCTFVRWDGEISPCMGLLHSNTTYINSGRTERCAKNYSLGNIIDTPLLEIWHSKEYIDFRNKVDAFDFSPCHLCGGCHFSEENEEDCFGNSFPTCGGCLWAQGVIQCP